MNYLPYALVALLAYSFVAPLMRRATSGAGAIPSDVAALSANSMLVVATLGVIVLNGDNVVEHVDNPKMRLVALAGVCLAIGILAYYRALARGPVSLVTPIFGLFLVVSSAVGVLVLEEPLTARKALGILFAIVAVILVAGD